MIEFGSREKFLKEGILTVQNFLSEGECLEFTKEISPLGFREFGKMGFSVYGDSSTLYSRQEVFKDVFSEENIKTGGVTLVQSKFIDLKPKLESLFNISLNNADTPVIHSYAKGQKLLPHLDVQPSSNEEGPLRKLSVVLFLNDETEKPARGSYCGGKLTFYNVFDKPPFNALGFPVKGERGLLVVFRPDILHEVTTVTAGRRLVVTSWFY